MPTFKTRLTKSGSKRVQAIIRRKGNPPLHATFSSMTIARQWAKQVEAEITLKRHLPRVEAERHTLKDATARYISEQLPTLAPVAQQPRQKHLEWWNRRLGAVSLAALSPVMISDARSELLQRVSGPTSNRYLAALSAVLETASREWGWVDVNPCRQVSRRPEHRGRVRFLSDEERERLLAACKASYEPRLYPLVLFALVTGARRGELLGLRWQDVDLVNLRAVLHETKNRDRRTLAFPGLAGDVLREMSRTPHISGDVFGVRRGRQKPAFPRAAWCKALKEAEIEDFRYHDCRHSAASYLAMSGASLAELAAFLGHRSLNQVARYSHLTEQHQVAVAERMAESYFPGALQKSH